MSPSTEDICWKQSARQAAVRKRIASRNCNENTNILPCRLVTTTSPPPKTPPRYLLKFNGKGKKWKTPEGKRVQKLIERLTFDTKEVSVSPLSLALGGVDDDVVIDRSAVGKRVACYNRVGELHFGKVEEICDRRVWQ